MNELNNAFEKILRAITVAVAVVLVPALIVGELVGYGYRGIAEVLRNTFREPLDISHDMVERIRRATYNS